MNSTLEIHTISLDEKIKSVNATYFPTPSVLEVLEVSDTTLGRYRDDLLNAKVGFEWHFYQTGCDKKTLEILWQYTQLVRLMRRSKAKELISQHMENYWYGVSSKNTA